MVGYDSESLMKDINSEQDNWGKKTHNLEKNEPYEEDKYLKKVMNDVNDANGANNGRDAHDDGGHDGHPNECAVALQLLIRLWELVVALESF